jgi:hypothetical protein
VQSQLLHVLVVEACCCCLLAVLARAAPAAAPAGASCKTAEVKQSAGLAYVHVQKLAAAAAACSEELGSSIGRRHLQDSRSAAVRRVSVRVCADRSSCSGFPDLKSLAAAPAGTNCKLAGTAGTIVHRESEFVCVLMAAAAAAACSEELGSSTSRHQSQDSRSTAECTVSGCALADQSSCSDCLLCRAWQQHQQAQAARVQLQGCSTVQRGGRRSVATGQLL